MKFSESQKHCLRLLFTKDRPAHMFHHMTLTSLFAKRCVNFIRRSNGELFVCMTPFGESVFRLITQGEFFEWREALSLVAKAKENKLVLKVVNGG